jgi:hypothetical protein
MSRRIKYEMNGAIVFQNDEEQDAFRHEQAAFVTYLPELYELCDLFVWNRELTNPAPAEKAVWALGSLALESFDEILLLAANARGWGAMKLLRVLYENVVSAGYITKKPSEADRFFEYQHVLNFKLANRVDKDFRALGGVSSGVRAEFDKEYDAVKVKFKGSLNWSGIPLDKMAEIASPERLENLYALCSSHPNDFIHSSPLGIAAKIKNTATTTNIDLSPNRQIASYAVSRSHALLVELFRIQNECFRLELEDQIVRAEGNFLRVWPGPPTP